MTENKDFETLVSLISTASPKIPNFKLGQLLDKNVRKLRLRKLEPYLESKFKATVLDLAKILVPNKFATIEQLFNKVQKGKTIPKPTV